jgi:DNA-damage-inducible protein J
MAKTGYITARIEQDLKSEAEGILSKVGLSATQTITLLYQQIVLNKGLPFEVRLPNNYVQQTIKEAQENPRTLSKYQNFDDLLQELHIQP